ncbi:MAG TPA: glutamate--tRNA ligase [Candidatus Azoamicus sp. OHIO1]
MNNIMNTIITRFAPSPTGSLHLGNIRVALFSWILARQNNGKFILRIDDTDKNRNSEIYTENIIKIMNWLSLYYDIGPIFQSKRIENYKIIVKKLIEENNAYICHCSTDYLKNLRTTQLLLKIKPKYNNHCRNLNIKKYDTNSIIRFKNPLNDTVEFIDTIRGKIIVSNTELDDFVIFRGNSLPTYNFASTIDDIEMKVTDIIRGDDHLSNTSRQINLMTALKSKVPKFTHVPMILGQNKKPLSKRDNLNNLYYYESNGFLPNAIINYILKLGWSYENKEIFTRKEILDFFKIENINKSPSMFDIEKLLWFNKQFIKNLKIDEIIKLIEPIKNKYNLDYTIGPKMEDLITFQKNRITTLEEIISKNLYFFEKETLIKKDDFNYYFSAKIINIINEINIKLKYTICSWNINNIKNIIKTIQINNNITLNEITEPLRLAITGKTTPNPIFEIIFLSGKEMVTKKLEDIIKYNKN